MHVKTARGLADITFALFKNTLNMFPTHAIGRHWGFGWRRQCFTACQKGAGDIICIGGFGKIIGRAHFHGSHRSRNRAITGQNDNTRIDAGFANGIDHIKAVAVLEPQIDHGISRRAGEYRRTRCRHRRSRNNVKAALFHGAAQARQKDLVVIDKKQAGIGTDFNCIHG